MMAMAVAAGAAAAAIGAIWLAWDQGSKLLAEAGGWDGLLAGLQTLAGGEGLFAGIDATANAKARAEAARRRGGGSASDLVSDSVFGSGAAPEAALPPEWGSSSAPLSYTDQSTVNVTVAGGATPAATGRAVAGAVVGAQKTNARGVRAALVGAGRD
jgi:hypothetical protein